MKFIKLFLVCLLAFASASVRAYTPIEYIENKGQWGSWFSYLAHTKGGDVLLEKDGIRYILADRYNKVRLDSFHHGQIVDNPLLNFHCYKVTFEGALQPTFVGSKPQQTYYNFFLGNDSSRWKSFIHPYYAVDYKEIYSNIDLHIYSENEHVVYDFIVNPGGDVNNIRLNFEGQNDLYIKKGNLIIKTSVGDVAEMKPYAYQYIDDKKVEVACEYSITRNTVTYNFPNDYDHSKVLVIDPTIVFSSLTGSTWDNWGFSATYDNAGNFYAGGLVNGLDFTGSFPVSPGAFQTTFGGGFTSGLVAYAADISIFKYNPTGTSRVYATLIGGAGNEHVHSMIVDQNNNLILAGRTKSTNYPITAGAFQTVNHGDWDMVVTNLNPTGSGLVGSTYIGGSNGDCVNFDSTEVLYGELKRNYGDESRSEVQVDRSGNIYVAACTKSTNFPTTSTAISSTLSGVQDAVVFKMNNNCSSLIWSTYLGGSAYDAAYVLAFDTAQTSLYVSGGTNSANFPTTSGSWQTSYSGGGADGFITRFQNGGSYSLQKSSFVGTSGYDQCYGVQVDYQNNVYMMGQSVGGLFPVTSGVYSNPNSSQFIIKMDRDVTSNLISTVYGSGNPSNTNISPVAFLVDTCENVYVSGWGGNLNLGGFGLTTGTCTGMPTTTGAATDGNDFYFIVLGSGLASLRYATFYGRNCSNAGHGEHVDGGTSRFDKNGIIYQAICASCGGAPTVPGACPDPFPTTPGVWSEVDSSTNCNEAALKIAFEIGPVNADVTAGPTTSGCAPLSVNFFNNTINGLSFIWNFGDGSPTSTAFAPSHTFTAAGTYTVTLSATNSSACFVTNDTAKIIITVDTNNITPDFTYTVTDSCGPYKATFTNTSILGSTPGASAFTTYNWYFSDGGSFTGTTPPEHNFPSSGTYTVTLVMTDTTACNSPDTVSKVFSLNGFDVSGTFTMPDTVCLGTAVTPLTTISNATTVSWVFGDGGTSGSASASHTYTAVGTYIIVMIVENPNSCNGADTFTKAVTVVNGPTADFSFQPNPPVANTPTSFTNLSTNATYYTWEFGDGITSSETNPTHQYTKTGTYTACLTARNGSNCPAKLCREVSADIVPIVGLPSGFSPNGDGENDVLYVRGAAIGKMNLKIFNRWGQLIFESDSQSKGWDGSFNGEPQPIEAYGYVLTVTFIDGTFKTLKGNVTLLR